MGEILKTFLRALVYYGFQDKTSLEGKEQFPSISSTGEEIMQALQLRRLCSLLNARILVYMYITSCYIMLARLSKLHGRRLWRHMKMELHTKWDLFEI